MLVASITELFHVINGRCNQELLLDRRGPSFLNVMVLSQYVNEDP